MIAASQVWKDPSKGDEGSLNRLGEISIPTYIANVHDDFMIPTRHSVIMQQKIPDARLKIFPDSGHAFLHQFAEEFANDVARFLDAL